MLGILCIAQAHRKNAKSIFRAPSFISNFGGFSEFETVKDDLEERVLLCQTKQTDR